MKYKIRIFEVGSVKWDIEVRVLEFKISKNQIFNLKNISLPTSRYLFLCLFLFVSCYLSLVTSVFALTPAQWQQNSVGLKTTQNTQKDTGGLGFMVRNSSGPLLRLHGGVSLDSYRAAFLVPAKGIDLGLIKIPGQSGSLTSETTDWAHNSLNFNSGALNITVSRLSPAILTQSNNNSLRFLSGNVDSRTFSNNTISPVSTNVSRPKFIAYSSGGTVQIRQLSGSTISLPALDNKWALVWYGSSSHFVDTKKPLSYSDEETTKDIGYGSMPQRYAYQADAPILFVFQNNPTSVVQNAGEGGVDFNFSAGAGNVSMLPIFGREHLDAAVTNGWSTSLPANVLTKINFWAPRSCAFPQTVSETYNYSAAADTATVTNNFTFVPVCSGIQFAPIPPMLGVARGLTSLGTSFSGAVVDSNTPSEFGPLLGIDNTASFSWSIPGLKRYTDNSRVLGSGSVPADVTADLNAEVDKITQSGHLAPWIFVDRIPQGLPGGDVYWRNPADVIYHLTEIIPAVSDQSKKTNLINYLKSERANFPPETIANLDMTTGKQRGDYNLEGTAIVQDVYDTIVYPQYPLKRVPLYNFFSLARYYDITGEAVPSSVMTAAKNVLDSDMAEMDWANMFPFQGFEDRLSASQNANRHFAGIVGLTKLSKKSGDTATENLGRALLAKAIVSRLGMLHYPRYLEQSGLQNLPTDMGPDWMVKQFEGLWYGFILTYNWTTAADDARQMYKLNQFQAYLNDNTTIEGFNRGTDVPYLIGYRDMVPELARVFADHAQSEAMIYFNKYVETYPLWHMAYSDGILGGEHGLNHPIDSFQLFVLKGLVGGDTAANLVRYASFPWLSQGGDLFYVQKLAEAAKAYQGVSWSDGGSPLPSSTPLPSSSPSPAKPGDLDGDNDVDIFDYNILLTNFGKTGVGVSGGDIDGNNKVDIFDYNILLTNFGK